MRNTNEWEYIAGHRCCECNGPASHIYGTVFWCCDCHVGKSQGPFTREESYEKHIEVLMEHRKRLLAAVEMALEAISHIREENYQVENLSGSVWSINEAIKEYAEYGYQNKE